MPDDVPVAPPEAPTLGPTFIDERADEEKPWNKFLEREPVPEAAHVVSEGWTLLHDGRSLQDGLIAAAAELVSDLIWGNLALPISKTLEKLEIIKQIWATPEAERTEEQVDEEAACRRECREMLELSTNQLEDMMERKGEFGREYRIVTAAWYMMMMPETHLRSPLMAPVDASKAAWEFKEREYERRRVEGAKWRNAREDETIFDAEYAAVHPFEFGQTRRRYEFTVTVPVPAKTMPGDVRVTVSQTALRIMVAGHPLNPVIDGETFREMHRSDTACDWHLEGEFETRRLVLDLDKKELANWPCLMLADAPAESSEPRPKLSGATGEVDVYAEQPVVLDRPTKADRFFSWGAPPQSANRPAGGSRAVQALKERQLRGKQTAPPPEPPPEPRLQPQPPQPPQQSPPPPAEASP